jgi:hypothetical protein
MHDGLFVVIANGGGNSAKLSKSALLSNKGHVLLLNKMGRWSGAAWKGEAPAKGAGYGGFIFQFSQ